MEEPENGIHPERVKPMLELLHSLTADVREPASEANPLRQVIDNTHSPGVVGQVRADELLLVVPVFDKKADGQFTRPGFRWLNDTWRAATCPEIPPISRGLLFGYLNPHEAARSDSGDREPDAEGPRVLDREDIRQMRLPLRGYLRES